MRASDLITRLLHEHDTAVMLVRGDAEGRANLLGHDVEASIRVPSPVDGEIVTVALLRTATGFVGRPTLAASRGSGERPPFVRLLDRFFVPAAGDPAVSACLFELIADHYEEFAAADINRRSAEALLRTALAGLRGGGSRKVLDFGCGTGCALDAVVSLRSEHGEVELLGTDISEPMLAIARSRGEAVISLDRWRETPPEAFDAAISCFVLHYGVPAHDLHRIARQLKPGGSFCCNLFKPDEQAVAHVVGVLQEAGLDLRTNEQSKLTPSTNNRHLAFRKPALSRAS